MKQKLIIRKAKNKENPYAQIAKTAVQDKRLSWKATGLLGYILSLPDDWRINLVDLARRKSDGVFATRAALKELAIAGYVVIESHRNDKGQFIGHEHLVFESPQLQESPQSRISHSGILDTTNTELTKDGIPDWPYDLMDSIDKQERLRELHWQAEQSMSAKDTKH